MNIETYLSVLEKYKHLGFIIGDQASELLFLFPNVNYLSSYEAYSSLKQGDPTMDYKNTHKRVKRLESLEFIEPVKAKEVKVEDAKNRAKYYRISEAGMFYMFFREAYAVSDLLPSIIEAHGNYLIFETLLYPYFKKETLKALVYVLEERSLREGASSFEGPAVEILDMICKYIGNCCREIYWCIPRNPKLKNQEKALHDRELKQQHLDRIALEKDHLVTNILLMFRSYRKAKRPDARAILAQDDKFMNTARDLHKDFNRSFEIADKIWKGTLEITSLSTFEPYVAAVRQGYNIKSS